MPARSVIFQSKQSAVGVRLSVICWDYGQRHSSVLPCPFEKAQRQYCLLGGSAPDQQSRGQVGKSRAPKGLKQRAGAHPWQQRRNAPASKPAGNHIGFQSFPNQPSVKESFSAIWPGRRVRGELPSRNHGVKKNAFVFAACHCALCFGGF